jgi:hypothetical protein
VQKEFAMNLRRVLATSTLWAAIVACASAQSGQPATPSSETSGSGAHAQAQQPAAAQPDGSKVGQELTLSGCLMRHHEIPTPTGPSDARAVKHDGYMLVDASTVPHHKGVNGMRPAVSAASATSAAHAHPSADAPSPVNQTANVGDSQMFKIVGLPDGDLEPFAGKRVTLMGDLLADAGGRPAAATAVKDTDHDAASFRATMIHPSSSPCRR